jgi:hydroxymethylbilane synthase
MTKIIIGARGSKLSLAYVEKVKELLFKENKELKGDNINFTAIKTSGDINQNIKLSEIGGKNLFCKEIEEKLINNDIDIAVHSLKDMESVENNKLIIGAYIKRNDCRDVIISNKIKDIKDLKGKIVIGSSSRRRELQLKKINQNISVVDIRGNIDTRIKKLEEKKLDGIILAAAGIKSLHLNNKISISFEPDVVLPAAGQGIIAVQCKKDDEITKNFLKNINDPETELCAKAERKMLQVIGGDCKTAIGGLAVIENNNLKLKAQLFSDLGSDSFEYELSGRDIDAINIGKAVGKKLLNLAGKKFKKNEYSIN